MLLSEHPIQCNQKEHLWGVPPFYPNPIHVPAFLHLNPPVVGSSPAAGIPCVRRRLASDNKDRYGVGNRQSPYCRLGQESGDEATVVVCRCEYADSLI